MNVKKIIKEEIENLILQNEFDENVLEKLYHNTYRYNGIINTYHLSTNPNLVFDGDLKSERGGDGDYIYSSLNYKEWLDVFDKENLGEKPKYLYVIRLTNPKYKSGVNLFNNYTPPQFMSDVNQTKIVKYIGEIK